jgi:hypothetical protein
MNHIRDYSDLQQFGIHYQTSEACGVGIRLRIGYTVEGRDYLSTFLGIELPAHEPPQWDNLVGDMMLPISSVNQLAIWCLLHQDQYVAAGVFTETAAIDIGHRGIVGLTRERMDEVYVKWRDWGWMDFYFRNGTAANGLTNQHVWSGRIY